MERKEFRILLIEDDEDDFLLVEDMLSQIPGAKCTLDWVASYDEGLSALGSERHDVCLLDFWLSIDDGMGILRWAKENGCGIPIIILSGHGDHRVDFDVMKAGAADYLSKGEVTPSLLERSIRHAVARTRAEKALRESEERFRFMAENSGDALYQLRYDSMQYQYISPSIKALTGYSPEEVVKLGFSSLVLQIDAEGREDLSPATLRQKRITGETGEHKADYLIRTESGALKWLSDHSVRWTDQSGRLIGSIGILSDITERKQAEQVLRESEKQLRLLSSKLLTVQETERTRLARNLHDTVGQSLAAVKYKVENALNSEGSTGDEAMTRSLKTVVPVLQKLIDSVRSIYMDLRPTILDDFGIAAVIGWLCREFETSHANIAIKIKTQVDEEMIPASLKSIIFRIAQEALSNISRHSKATRALLMLRTTDLAIELEVRDNGIGFDAEGYFAAADTLDDGIGLASVRARTRLSDGSLSIKSETGKGTTLRATWPNRHRD
ncbi:MAG: PAS domain S-box protein [Syntrophobacteraceae bacterium]